jgi:protein-tyrosine phosphatase
MDLNFITNPTDYCHWLIYDHILVGAYPYTKNRTSKIYVSDRLNHLRTLITLDLDVYVSLVEDHEIKKYGDYTKIVGEQKSNTLFLSLPTPDNGVASDKEVSYLVNQIYHLYLCGKKIYIHCWGGHGRTSVISACLLKYIYRYTTDEALDYVRLSHLSRGYHPDTIIPSTQKQIQQIHRYQRPIKALFCGDRFSTTIFEESITLELKDLPWCSTVIHGACQGVDQTTHKIAQNLGIKIEAFPANWKRYGKIAGPLRNQKMLEEEPDIIHAFHPDINSSKGTKDMITRAYQQKIPVYIHDQKRKVLFRGDFTDI